MERAKEVTREGKWTRIQYARFADDRRATTRGREVFDRTEVLAA